MLSKIYISTSYFNHFTLYLITNNKRISCSPILREYSIFLDDSTDVYRECIDEYIAAVFGHFLGAEMKNDKKSK